MKFMLILAAIPVLTLSGGYALRPAMPVRAIEVEGVRAQRMDSNTFRHRYGPVADMPPAVETRLEPLLLVTHDPIEMRAREHSGQDRVGIGTSSANRSDGSRLVPASTYRVSHSYSICSRHGMRKVYVGRYKWRCRR